MKDTNVKIDQLGGIFETYPQPENSLLELENFQVNVYTKVGTTNWDMKSIILLGMTGVHLPQTM